jgi:hypothetical protein
LSAVNGVINGLAPLLSLYPVTVTLRIGAEAG